MRGHGPAKRPPFDTRLRGRASVAAITFTADYTFRFDPPRSSVTHFWTDPRTGRERRFKYHVIHYFVPDDDTATTIVTFGFLKIDWPSGPALRACNSVGFSGAGFARPSTKTPSSSKISPTNRPASKA